MAALMLPATYYILILYGPCVNRQYTTIIDSNFSFLHSTDVFENYYMPDTMVVYWVQINTILLS